MSFTNSGKPAFTSSAAFPQICPLPYGTHRTDAGLSIPIDVSYFIFCTFSPCLTMLHSEEFLSLYISVNFFYLQLYYLLVNSAFKFLIVIIWFFISRSPI